MVLGREKLALQGLFIADWSSVRWCSERQLADLAGNAFCTANAGPMQLLSMIVVARLLREAGAPRLLQEPGLGGAGQPDESSDDDDEPCWALALEKRV